MQRLYALWIDAAILGAIQWPFGHMFGIWLGAGSVREVVNVLFVVVICWPYFAWFESSEHQATPRKRMIGIVVVDLQANRLTFARASGRALTRWLNTLTGFGYLMCPLLRKGKQLCTI
ncbi:MAG TPA: RDD family protein [Silvibacterium sp.]|nr:RDD family protein [Silvibacterium sp.]